MALSARTSGVATLVLRVITLGLLTASLVILATARIHEDTLYYAGEIIRSSYDITFKDHYALRYVFSVAAIGCAYTLLVIPLAAIAAVKGMAIGGASFVRLHIFTDIIFCALFSTGGAAGLGFVVDHQIHNKGDPSRVLRFLHFVDASCGLLLAAAICTVVMIMISVSMKT
ncbi:hypothetical protein BAE44_0023929 [Dichanthelium oligosanthes]|uniref:CASP-like protein n=1 Tax=Dichanthelium oligosanthes TaxID=888268 RepID=A0A1E5UQB1_9POAL|nr:hypothetical protein BAE44_0023929 [Dichanthelium oligosanthes]